MEIYTTREGGMEVRARMRPYYLGEGLVDVYCWSKFGELKGERAVPEVTWRTLTVEERREREGREAQPMVTMIPAAAQQLMNDLWELGIRPAAARATGHEVELVTRHLEDLRKIAFHALKVK